MENIHTEPTVTDQPSQKEDLASVIKQNNLSKNKLFLIFASLISILMVGSIYIILFSNGTKSIANAATPINIYNIYNDALGTNWSQSSESRTSVSLTNTTNVFSGARSISYRQLSTSRNKLFFHTNQAVSTTAYTTLHFVAKASTANQKYAVSLKDSRDRVLGTPVPLANVGGNPNTTSWQVYDIPLETLSAKNTTITGFVLQSASSVTSAQPVVYLDEIQLLTYGVATASPTISQLPTSPTPVSSVSATPTPQIVGLTFADEFDGVANASPDTTKWVAEVGTKLRNNEDQYYTPFSNKNAFQDGQGNLVIEARRENYNGSSFTSAALDSVYKQKYGRIEWRARMDSLQNGVWPALWTFGDNWPKGGELDMMEWFADPNNPVAEANIHGSDTSTDRPWGGKQLTGIDLLQWNVYSVEWRPTFIEFKVNGVQKAYAPSSSWLKGWSTAFLTPQMIVVNIAMNNGGVSWMGSNAKLLPSFTKARMYVDYVRVYQ